MITPVMQDFDGTMYRLSAYIMNQISVGVAGDIKQLVSNLVTAQVNLSLALNSSSSDRVIFAYEAVTRTSKALNEYLDSITS